MPDKTYIIPVSEGLLEHQQRMGNAIWEFLWSINRVTNQFTDDEGVRWGEVLGGKPVTYEEIASECGTGSKYTTRNRVKRLVEEGYWSVESTPHGFKIRVRNSKKWFGQRANKEPSDLPKMVDDPTKNGTSQPLPPTKNGRVSDQKWSGRPTKNGRSNKDKTVDSTGQDKKAAAAREDFDLDKLVKDSLELGNNIMPSPFQYKTRADDILSFIDSGVDPQAIEFALEIAVRRDANSWGLPRSIINSWQERAGPNIDLPTARKLQQEWEAKNRGRSVQESNGADAPRRTEFEFDYKG